MTSRIIRGSQAIDLIFSFILQIQFVANSCYNTSIVTAIVSEWVLFIIEIKLL